uniref:ABC transporter permease n=1 Tax=Anotrichium furcellatum TaxID=41999 RepID=A0A4D6WRQ2_9FLOR|nr:hypothetical protein [Anotrichium furcellatum]
MCDLDIYIFLEQINIVSIDSILIILVSAFFISLVFSLQLVKEFIYLNAVDLIGSVLSITFLREISPVLTAIVLIGKIGSYFTAQLATMQITEQIDALYILNISPFNYLILPRIFSLVIMLPILNILYFITSLFSSLFICFSVYNIDTCIFFDSVLNKIDIIDCYKSSLKASIFGFSIAIISCACGFTAQRSSKSVGIATTLSVVISLLFIFMLDFVLSYYMFDNSDVAFAI